MGLRETAKADNEFILSGDAQGFRWPLQVIAPDGTTLGDDPENPFYGFSNDISEFLDPDTGVMVSTRVASAAMHMQPLLDAFNDELPVGVADPKSDPWQVLFDDINGKPHTFKVLKSNPDRSLGMITVLLEIYDDGN